MSRPRYRWWSYVKNIARAYPQLAARPAEELHRRDRKERLAVERALCEISRLPDGEARVGLVERTLFKRSHTLEGAALAVGASYMTARRYQGDFLTRVAEGLELL